MPSNPHIENVPRTVDGNIDVDAMLQRAAWSASGEVQQLAYALDKRDKAAVLASTSASYRGVQLALADEMVRAIFAGDAVAIKYGDSDRKRLEDVIAHLTSYAERRKLEL